MNSFLQKYIFPMLFVSFFINICFNPLLTEAKTADYKANPPTSAVNINSTFVIPDTANSYLDSSFSNTVVITDNIKNQRGCIWTKGRVNLGADFTYNSYLYVGKTESTDENDETANIIGDGMTFTIHNDPRGLSTLGGFAGAIGAYTHSTNTAISNAISFEIDPYLNVLSTKDGNYDNGMTQNNNDIDSSRHVAFVNPVDSIGASKHFQLKSFKDINFSASTWVPFRIDWRPQTNGSAIMTVTINNNAISHTITDYQKQFNGQYGYFGYTGSTGGATALQAISVTQLPIFNYQVTFNLNGATGTTPAPQSIQSGEVATAPAAPNRTGYTFSGWNTKADGTGTNWSFTTNTVTDNIVLYAKWVKNSYNLRFNINGGNTNTTPAAQVIDYGEKANNVTNPTKEGAQFTNWNTQADGSGTTWKFDSTTMPASDTTLYAQWNNNMHTLSFNINNGDSEPPKAQILDFATLAIKVDDPTRHGHKFLGWNTEANGSGTTWNFANDIMPDNNVTLYATWQPYEYQIRFNANTDGGSDIIQNIPFGSIASPIDNPIRAGYTFSGWNTNSDNTGTEWNFDSTLMPDHDVTLYAQWEKNSYTLKFDTNGGESATPETQNILFEEHSIIIPDPTKDNYEFIGWNTASDGSGTAWDLSTTSMPPNDVTLYAQWAQIDTRLIPNTGDYN